MLLELTFTCRLGQNISTGRTARIINLDKLLKITPKFDENEPEIQLILRTPIEKLTNK